MIRLSRYFQQVEADDVAHDEVSIVFNRIPKLYRSTFDFVGDSPWISLFWQSDFAFLHCAPDLSHWCLFYKGIEMDWTLGLAAFAALGLAAYLIVALLKPELFA